MEDKTKTIELTEKEQKDLFCAAWHLANFIEDEKDKKVAGSEIPCETCKYQKDCHENYIFDPYKHFQTLSKLTGVIISARVGFRDSVKKGVNSFFTDNII